eukprot:NODE_21_length_38511_cov_0.503306.p13 type:complete len:153 gc:universal NODE_21_length_38511_cov_0.503306:661-1119(+)
MLSWWKDKDNRVSFIPSRLRFKSKRRVNSTSSSDSDATLIHFDDFTQNLINTSVSKLELARSMREQVVITNSVAAFYPYPFQEREFIDYSDFDKLPIGRSSLHRNISKDTLDPPFIKQAMELVVSQFRKHELMRKRSEIFNNAFRKQRYSSQ